MKVFLCDDHSKYVKHGWTPVFFQEEDLEITEFSYEKGISEKSCFIWKQEEGRVLFSVQKFVTILLKEK